MVRFLLVLLTAWLFVGCSAPSLVNGKRVKREYFPKGQLKSEFIKDDATGKNGILKEYGLDGKVISVTPLRNGIKNGVQKLYDNQGRLAVETTYVDGRKNGPQKAYYENGKLWYILPFKNDKLHGHAVMYDRKGRIIRQADYVNGKRVG
jgi:antitoxin component YwqK of YwqJK toxin-antitoxin module